MSGLPTDAFPGSGAGPRPVRAVRSARSVRSAGARGASTEEARPQLSEASAVVDLLARLPVPLRGELRRVLRPSGALDPVIIDAEAAAAMVKPYAVLLRAIGPDGIRLTQAGWLPPAFVRDVLVQLGWEQRLRRADRENAVYPLAQLRQNATRFGLLRKANGVLRPTAAARAVADDPVALWHVLACAVVRRADSVAERDILTLIALEVAADRYPARRIVTVEDAMAIPVLHRLGFGMDALGWAALDGSPLLEDTLRRLARAGLHTLEGPGVFVDGSESNGASEGGRAFARAMLQAELE